jgi:propionyl-CoA synthetase
MPASGDYPSTYRASLADPDAFWLNAAKSIAWVTPPQQGFDPAKGWFADGVLNTCYNALDRHVIAGRGDVIALVHHSPVTGNDEQISYAELTQRVAQTAGMLSTLGVTKGDRVLIYMPMIPETVYAMLACARIGAIHSVVFGGFAAPELAKRIDDAQPKVVLTASCGIEASRVIPYKPLVDQALALARHSVDHVLVYQRPQALAELGQPHDLDWAEQFACALAADCVPMNAGDPLYILYTSGTTGTPKGVVRDNGGHAVTLCWSMLNIYGASVGDVFWAASDVGWVVGHSYIVYGPLLAGCTTILFEGKPVGTPDAGTFWRAINRYNVDIFFTAPTAIRAIRKEDPDAEILKTTGTGRLRAMFLAGERADPDTLQWTETQLSVPVIDHWWQTELGWPAVATTLGLGDERRKAGSAGFPVPGYQFAILADGGDKVAPGQTGNLAIQTPLPPGCFMSLWKNEKGYQAAFETFPGFYETGDAGHIDEDGFLHVMGRTDDLINVAGHRLSTGQMEQILTGHPAISESAVVGIDDPIKGAVPLAFVVSASLDMSQDAKQLESILVKFVRDELGAVASLRRVYVVDALPKTRSGKILRGVLRKIANGEAIESPPTIENPDALISIRSLFS